MRDTAEGLLFAVGLLIVAAGLWLIYHPLGVIAAGLWLVLLAWGMVRADEHSKRNSR